MNRFKKCVCALGLIATLSVFGGATAFAATGDEVSGKLSQLNTSVDASGNLTINGTSAGTVNTEQADGLAGITINGKKYFVTEDALNNIDKAADSAISNVEAKAHDKSAAGVNSQLNDIVQAYDIKADTGGAATALSGFRDFVSIAAGVLVYITLTVVSLITVVDILYLGVPFMRTFLDGKGADSNSTTKDGMAKAKYVSDEAAYAVKKATTGETYQSPVLIYIGKRLVFVIIMGIAIVLLVTGNIALIMQISISLTSGVIDMVSNAFAAGH